MKVSRIWVFRFLSAVRLIGYRAAVALIVVVVSGFNFFYAWQPSQKAEALDSAKMLLFWDGFASDNTTPLSVPTGWSVVSTYDGKFPRGDTPVNVLQTGGTATHSITTTTNSMQYVAGSSANQTTGVTSNNNTHTHTLNSSITGATAANDPAHRTLKLIQFDTGIPTSIPGGAVALFDVAPGAGWTRETEQDGKMLKIGSSVGTGGSDTHTHTITWPSLNASAGNNAPNGTGHNISAAGHTHLCPNTPSCQSSTVSETSTPPYVQPMLYKADSTIATPDGLIGLFDANPGGGWAVQSNSGGIFYQQFMRGASTFSGTSTGSLIHSHASLQSPNAGLCTSCSLVSGTGGFPGSPTDHSHRITTNFSADDNHVPEYVNFVIAKKSLPAMMMFWDDTDANIPVGWAKVTDFNGRLPRGEAPANYGDLGGNATAHTHTNSSVSASSTASTTISSVLTGSGANATHAHGAGSASLSAIGNAETSNVAVNNLPAYRTLKLIRYTGGTIPTTLPAGAITIFDNSPGIPLTEFSPGNPYWTRYSAQDNKYAAVVNADADRNSTTVLGTGSDTHTHDTTWTGTLANTNSSVLLNCILCGSAPNASSTTHNHTMSGSNNSNTGTAPNQPAGETIPPHVKVWFAKANYDVPTISLGLIAMFDGDPGSGWVIKSAAGGTFNKRFLRPASSYSAPTTSNLCEANFGCDYHNHTSVKASNGPSNTANTPAGAGNNGAAKSDHTHQVTATFTTGSSESNYVSNNEYFLPPFFNVVIAEKVDFKQSNYRWFDNSNTSEDVSSGWSSLDVLADSVIPTLPTAYNPPLLATRLRLRVKIQVNNANLAALEKTFRFQYKKSVDSLCDSTGSWADVGAINSGEVWRFVNSSITDGTTLTQTRLTSDVKQVYVKSNPTALNVNAVVSGQYMEYDFHLEDNGAPGASQYSFRVVEENGTLFSEYTNCPTLVTAPDAVNQMRHGNFFEESSGTSGRERGFFWAD